MARDIEAWESEGGAAPERLGASEAPMSGTAAQVEWAERIKLQVNADFDRVAASFRSIAGGYFIHDWQEISDQVRQMIFHDARYQAIKSRRAAPERTQLDTSIEKQHKRQTSRKNSRSKLTEPDVRTPEEIRVARESSRPAQGWRRDPHSDDSTSPSRSHFGSVARRPSKADG